MAIIVDVSTIGITPDGVVLSYSVVRCTDCPFWAAMRDTRAEALSAAVDHEERVHPGRDGARRRRDRT